MTTLSKTLDLTSKYLMPVHDKMKSFYCKTAISWYSDDRIRYLTLPFAVIDNGEMIDDEECGMMVDLIHTRLIDVPPEIFYYFSKYDELYSDVFRAVIRSWNLVPLEKYIMADATGRLITLVTTGVKLYCVSVVPLNHVTAILPADCAN